MFVLQGEVLQLIILVYMYMYPARRAAVGQQGGRLDFAKDLVLVLHIYIYIYRERER